jgi:RNA polymerase sigma-70 factor (ECF subfamily)
MADQQPRDEVLIENALAGNETAFENLMIRHTHAVRVLIARYFRNRWQVDDLAQETFVRAFFALRDYRREAPFVFWLKQIAVRLCLDEVRNRRTGKLAFESMNSAEEKEINGALLSTKEELESRLQARLLVEKILAMLNPLDRMILVLMDAEGYDTNEVARLTRLTRANVKIRAFRLRRRLRAMLQQGERKGEGKS